MAGTPCRNLCYKTRKLVKSIGHEDLTDRTSFCSSRLYNSKHKKRTLMGSFKWRERHVGTSALKLASSLRALVTRVSLTELRSVVLASIIPSIKKEPLWVLLNGGNDEARTRDLMRDRHAL